MKQKKMPSVFQKIEEKAKEEAVLVANALLAEQKRAYLADLDTLEIWMHIQTDFALLLGFISGIVSTDASKGSIQYQLKHYNRAGAAVMCAQYTVKLVKFFRESGLDDPFPDELIKLVSQLGSLTDSLSKVESGHDAKLNDAIQQVKEDLKPVTGFWYDEALKAIWNKGGRPKLEKDEIMLEASQWRSEQKAITGKYPTWGETILHCQQVFPEDTWLSAMKKKDGSIYGSAEARFAKALKQYDASQTVFDAQKSRNSLP